MKHAFSRRQVLASAAAVATGIASSTSVQGAEPAASNDPKAKLQAAAKDVKYCLNMSTIRGQKLTLPQQVEVARPAKAN